MSIWLFNVPFLDYFDPLRSTLLHNAMATSVLCHFELHSSVIYKCLEVF